MSRLLAASILGGSSEASGAVRAGGPMHCFAPHTPLQSPQRRATTPGEFIVIDWPPVKAAPAGEKGKSEVNAPVEVITAAHSVEDVPWDRTAREVALDGIRADLHVFLAGPPHGQPGQERTGDGADFGLSRRRREHR